MGHQHQQSQATPVHTGNQRFTKSGCTSARRVATPHAASPFVDDDIYADIFDSYRIQQAVAASIEAIYILLGDSNLSKRQDPISFDKLEDMPVSFSSHILGQIVNTQRMDVETPPEFIADTIRLLQQSFSHHRKVFRLQDIESLTGKLGHIASTAPWLRFLLPDLYAEIAWCLDKHKHHLTMTNKQFRTCLKLHCNSMVPHNHKTFVIAKMAKAIHILWHEHFISKHLARIMSLITSILTDESVSRRCPIGHLVHRDLSAIAYSDSSLHVAGVFSTDLRF